MRYRPRTDRNQKSIVSGLRALGADVLILAGVGHGCPDLLVKFRSKLYLLEVKDGSKPPSARTLTEQERLFHLVWAECTSIVYDIESAYRAIGALV